MTKLKSVVQVSRVLLLAAIAVALSVPALAQTVKKTASYDITVKGSSNLHDWTMKAKGSGMEANMNMAPGVSYLAGIPSLSFTLPVKSLKSNESLMDERAARALNADKFPTISFKLTDATVSGAQQNKAQLNVTGLLTISGVARQLTLAASSVTNADGSVIVTG
ncbi:MAG: YceI family protein, partial [Candidatus Dadabacteria bacterium]